MAMIEYNVEEFLDQLITEKAKGVVSEETRLRAMKELQKIADNAIDVAIMKAVIDNVRFGIDVRPIIQKLEELTKAGDKKKTLKYLERVCPELDYIMVAELGKFKEIYLSGKIPDSIWP